MRGWAGKQSGHEHGARGMKGHWQQRKVDEATLAAAGRAGLSTLQAKLFAGRVTEADPERIQRLLRPRLSDLPPIGSLPDIEPAALRIAQAVMGDDVIAIAADFDADGASAAAVLWSLLVGAMGVAKERVHVVIAHRLADGYGVSDNVVGKILAIDPRPDLVITADQGSADGPRITRMKEAGIDVVVTDHHLIPEEGIPRDAVACVNPARADGAYPDKTIAGCMVAWCVMAMTMKALRDRGVAVAGSAMDALQYAGLGTLADCVDLGRSRVNRFAVQCAIERMRGSALPVWKAMARFTRGRFDSQALAFQICPRINAASRVRHADQAVAALCSMDESAANAWVDALDVANTERRAIQAELLERAIEMADESVAGGAVAALCITFYASGHAGVHGIVASKLVERYGVPTICLSMAEEPEGWMTGSVRSVEGIHIKAVLDRMAADHPELGMRYGGHAMAAGVRLPMERVPAFDVAWQEAVAAAAAGVARPAPVHDGSLAGHDPLAALAEIEGLEPFGKGFPAPVFCDTARLDQCVPMKPGSAHRVIHARIQGTAPARMVWFNGAAEASATDLASGQHVWIVYELVRDDYARGPGFERIVRDVGVISRR